MVRRMLFLVLPCLFLCLRLSASSSDADVADRVFIKLELDEKKIYANQPVVASVVLFSQSPSVAYANPAGKPQLVDGEFNYLKMLRTDGRGSKVKIDGREWYRFPLEAYVFSVSEKGKYSFRLPEYKVGVNNRVVVRDPFWGPMQTTETRNIDVKPEPLKFKVVDIPGVGSGADSGSIGEFSIKTVIPKGDILVGEEALAYVIVSGPGMIAENSLPEYRSAFNKGIKLKSVSENRGERFENGKLVSELTLELTFVPESKENSEIGPVSFDFFSPGSGKFKTVRSEPVTFIVKSTTARREHMDI